MVELAFNVLLTGFGASLLIYQSRELARALSSRRWPAVPAVVLTSYVEERTGRRGGARFEPVVLFQYRFGDTDYTAHRLAFGDVSTSTREESERIAARFSENSVWEVRVCPRRPDLHVIHPGPTKQLWYALAFLVVFAALAITFLVQSISNLRN